MDAAFACNQPECQPLDCAGANDSASVVASIYVAERGFVVGDVACTAAMLACLDDWTGKEAAMRILSSFLQFTNVFIDYFDAMR